jgi:hypothetical protein
VGLSYAVLEEESGKRVLCSFLDYSRAKRGSLNDWTTLIRNTLLSCKPRTIRANLACPCKNHDQDAINHDQIAICIAQDLEDAEILKFLDPVLNPVEPATPHKRAFHVQTGEEDEEESTAKKPRLAAKAPTLTAPAEKATGASGSDKMTAAITPEPTSPERLPTLNTEIVPAKRSPPSPELMPPPPSVPVPKPASPAPERNQTVPAAPKPVAPMPERKPTVAQAPKPASPQTLRKSELSPQQAKLMDTLRERVKELEAEVSKQKEERKKEHEMAEARRVDLEDQLNRTVDRLDSAIKSAGISEHLKVEHRKLLEEKKALQADNKAMVDKLNHYNQVMFPTFEGVLKAISTAVSPGMLQMLGGQMYMLGNMLGSSLQWYEQLSRQRGWTGPGTINDLILAERQRDEAAMLQRLALTPDQYGIFMEMQNQYDKNIRDWNERNQLNFDPNELHAQVNQMRDHMIAAAAAQQQQQQPQQAAPAPILPDVDGQIDQLQGIVNQQAPVVTDSWNPMQDVGEVEFNLDDVLNGIVRGDHRIYDSEPHPLEIGATLAPIVPPDH